MESDVYPRTSSVQKVRSLVCVTEDNLVGRPRLQITPEQLTTLYREAGFRWADVARTFGVLRSEKNFSVSAI